MVKVMYKARFQETVLTLMFNKSEFYQYLEIEVY